MSVKILGGVAKQFSLLVEDSISRPTSVVLRRKIFDRFQNLEGVSFIDICAGSGAMGIEAWSRGASEVILVEKNKKVFRKIEKNLKNLTDRFEEELQKRPVQILNKDALTWIKYFREDPSKEYIIFFDPPYREKELYKEFWDIFFSSSYQKAELWLESDSKSGIKVTELEKEPYKIFEQGDSYVALFELE